jgi:hypothetical protein
MPAMKSVAILLFAAALIAGCQNESKLDTSGGGGGGGDLAARVKKLEETNAKYAEALEFLQKVYGQQKQQQQQQEREEPDPTAVFAVDISSSIAGGLVEGPATGAPVTIVEAWDFA